jgi:hypothetical protein
MPQRSRSGQLHPLAGRYRHAPPEYAQRVFPLGPTAATAPIRPCPWFWPVETAGVGRGRDTKRNAQRRSSTARPGAQIHTRDPRAPASGETSRRCGRVWSGGSLNQEGPGNGPVPLGGRRVVVGQEAREVAYVGRGSRSTWPHRAWEGTACTPDRLRYTGLCVRICSNGAYTSRRAGRRNRATRSPDCARVHDAALAEVIRARCTAGGRSARARLRDAGVVARRWAVTSVRLPEAGRDYGTIAARTDNRCSAAASGPSAGPTSGSASSSAARDVAPGQSGGSSSGGRSGSRSMI